MDGTEAGLWIINANSLELMDSMITAPGVPWTIEFSPDYNTWYSCWGRGSNKIYSCGVNPLLIQNTSPVLYSNSSLVKSANQEYLVTYISKGIEIFERTTLNPVKFDTSSSLDGSTRITASRNSDKVYFTWVENKHLTGFGIYDLNSFRIVDSLKIFNIAKYSSLEEADLIVSNDDKFLYFSAWNWTGGFSGSGLFFVIDLFQKKIVKEFNVGAFSQLAISPDGQSVYISDPGGYLYNFQSTGKIWHFNVKNNSMSTLLDGLYYSDRITVAEDNRTLFITPFVSFPMKDGQKAWLIKVDALNGNIENYYPVFYDSTGFFTNRPINVKIGKYIGI